MKGESAVIVRFHEITQGMIVKRHYNAISEVLGITDTDRWPGGAASRSGRTRSTAPVPARRGSSSCLHRDRLPRAFMDSSWTFGRILQAGRGDPEDFGSRAEFVNFAEVTFVEWTKSMPASQHEAFIDDVLDRYRQVGDGSSIQADVFTFYQMEAGLRPARAGAAGIRPKSYRPGIGASRA